MLSNSPGSLGFEMAPFKLPQDYIDILGGFDSPKFAEFRALFKRCFRDARKHAERIITLVELMQKGAFALFLALSASARRLRRPPAGPHDATENAQLTARAPSPPQTRRCHASPTAS